MNPINLKDLYGKRYKIGFDPSVQYEEGGKRDPWYYLILCRSGNIYPYSDELLGFHCTSRIIRNRLHKEHPEIRVQNWSDDGEAIFLFPVELFDIVAEYAKPRKKRQVSESERKRLAEIGQRFLFKSEKHAIEVPETAPESTNAGRVIL